MAALAVSLAHWTWLAVAPPSIAAPPSSGQFASPETGRPLKRNLFGVPEDNVRLAAEPARGSGLKLRGVITPGPAAAGTAIFALEGGRSTTASPGDPVVPGVVLREVHADHVVVSRGGAIERIMLERRFAAPQAPRSQR